jgi:hypothetical protein
MENTPHGFYAQNSAGTTHIAGFPSHAVASLSHYTSTVGYPTPSDSDTLYDGQEPADDDSDDDSSVFESSPQMCEQGEDALTRMQDIPVPASSDIGMGNALGLYNVRLVYFCSSH